LVAVVGIILFFNKKLRVVIRYPSRWWRQVLREKRFYSFVQVRSIVYVLIVL